MLVALLAVVVTFSQAPAAADGIADRGTVVVGAADVIDGDTIDVDGRRIRLEGIDAPEMGQRCQRRDGSEWRCGQAAARRLSEYVAGGVVSCTVVGSDKYQRLLARCVRGPVDINAALVRAGLAWAFVKYSDVFLAEEHAARAQGAGIWQADNEAPWDYRQRSWQVAEQKAPEGCAIKGNISNNGRIYHMPWSPWYGRVRIDLSSGERWFCSEAEASEAGWRAVQSGS